MASLKKIVSKDPSNQTALMELGYAEGRAKNWIESAVHLKAALSLMSDDMQLRMDIGYALQNAGDVKGALMEFKDVALKEGPLRDQARGAVKALSAALDSDPKVTAALNESYLALRAGDRNQAKLKLKEVIAANPRHAVAIKQLAYLELNGGDSRKAAERFEEARKIDPKDYQSALQLGFIYYQFHDLPRAEQAFTSAVQSPAAKISESAKAALRVVRLARRRVYLDLFSSPVYLARFGDTVGYLEAQLHLKPRPESWVSLYMGSRYIQDSRSHGGSEPQIFSDNIFTIGPGVKIQPAGWNVSLSAEFNLVFNLLRSAERPDNTEGEWRTTLAGYRDFEQRLYGPIGLLTFGQAAHSQSFTDVGASIGYYSRYRDNVIGYAQAREGFRLWQGSGEFSVYLRGNLAADANNDFFNNFGEFGPGLELRPWIKENLKIRAEVLHGIYFGREGRAPNTYGPHYDDFRVMMLYGKRF